MNQPMTIGAGPRTGTRRGRSTTVAYTILGVYAVISSLGLLSLRAAMVPALPALRRHDWSAVPWFMLLGGASLYAVSFLLWLIVLAKLPVAVAFPIAVAVTVTLATLGSMIVLSEHVRMMQWLGIGFIIAGVFMTARA
jgi:drug/metabolite transporter (DMT)-like permease